MRLAVVLVFGLVALAAQLGLDLLLGGFVAGMITRVALRGREVAVFDSKLTAVGYGLLIPFFFVTSGMAFDLDALTSSARRAAQGADVRRALPGRPRRAGAAALPQRSSACATGSRSPSTRATELPLVVAITTLAIDAGHMRVSTAAGLVGAAIISTLIFPLLGARLRRGGEPVGRADRGRRPPPSRRSAGPSEAR